MLDELFKDLSYADHVRTYVGNRMLEAATSGDVNPDDLKRVCQNSVTRDTPADWICLNISTRPLIVDRQAAEQHFEKCLTQRRSSRSIGSAMRQSEPLHRCRRFLV